ncbi:MAG TPA: extracellular solute-binding protein [Anaerolineae bacterium]|nr:extracellular solute-binding protein [Anaerolineae bacterium]
MNREKGKGERGKGASLGKRHLPTFHFPLATFHFFFFFLLLSSCAATPETLLKPPRLATQTAQAKLLTRDVATVVATATAVPVLATEVVVSAEPTPLAPTSHEQLVVWVNETSADHKTLLRALGQQFEAQKGVQVEFVFIDAQNIVPLARSAQLTEQLPDIIFHDLEQSATLLALDILDVAAADGVINQLDPDTFMQDALTAQPLVDGKIAAIPVDGWQYLLVYRQDWFAEAGLDAPDTFEKLLVSAETFDTISFDKPDEDAPTPEPEATPTSVPPLRSGIVVPTEQDLPNTQRVFEWIATANGCQLADDAGEIVFEGPACLDALEFYRNLIIQYGPPDFQTDTTALKAFAAGRTAMAIVPPSALAYFADNAEFELDQAVGIVTELTGFADNGQASRFANFRYLGLVDGAGASATEFAQFWFEQAYGDWLSVEPVRKVPLRVSQGDVDWLAVWAELPLGAGQSLAQLYGDAVAGMLSAELTRFDRWNFGSLTSQLYEDLTIAPILTRMVSGYIGSYR